MHKRQRAYMLALALTVLFGAQAYGWGNGGHMAVAAVAYDRLTAQTRARVNSLIQLNPRFHVWQGMLPPGTPASARPKLLFMIAATWPDQIKESSLHFIADGTHSGNRPPTDGTADRNIGYTDDHMHKYWHFIDEPFSQDGTPTVAPPVPNALTQIDAFRAVLASNSPDPLKSYDLVWLLHLVGDVHQPLHCAARFGHNQTEGDDGGNGVNVCNPTCGARLHGFWDDLLGTSPNPIPARTIAQSLPAAPAAAANDLKTSDWIDEGFALAKSKVYITPVGLGSGPFHLTSTYRNDALALARRRVALAGARLANILNNELR